jgi:DNA-binding XRE family transcriptional regulator
LTHKRRSVQKQKLAFSLLILALFPDCGIIPLHMKTKDFETLKDQGIKELKQALDESGLTWSWAAERLEVTPSTVGRLLSKKHRPSLEMAINMRVLAKKVKKIMAVDE